MRRALAVAVLALLVVPGVGQASWRAGTGDWSHFRGDAQRSGSTAAPGAFDTDLADLRVKWTRHEDPGFWVPPVAADLDGDGVAEVVGTIGNASADPSNVAAPLKLESGVEVVDGATGALRWKVGPTAGNLAFYSPVLGDVDGDGKAEVVWLDGNPISGNSATNKVYAYKADGTKLWEWSDANWPATKTPLPLTSLAIGDVDGEGAHDEVVLQLLLAHVDLTIEGGTKVVLSMSQPEERLIALNGEGTPGISWQRQFPNASTSSPALADLDGDGKLDVLYGSGAKPGPLVDGSSFAINLSSDFADDHVRAFRGGATGQPLWSVETGRYPGEDFAPLLVDVDGDGVKDAVLHLWDRHLHETSAENTFIVALSGVDGHELWRTRLNASVYSPPAGADLDGDGKPEVVVQTGRGSAPDQRVVVALRGDGSVLWRSAAQPRSFSSSPAVGDLLGTGRPVVAVIEDAPSGMGNQLLLLDGRTGSELLRKDLGTRVASIGGPILADLDGDDGRAELLVNIGEWGEPGDLVAYEPELPDLRVTGLASNVSTHVAGQPETLRATVQNLGSRAAQGAVVRATDDGASLGEQQLDLAPGASADVSFPWTPAEGGPRTVRVAADPDGRIPEWSERNNDASASLFVHAPDLAFAAGDPRFSDATPGVGDDIAVNVTLRNVGGADARGALVRFLDDGATFAERTVDLAAGGSLPLSAALHVEGERNHVVRVVADPERAMGEEDEANNEAQALLRVRFLAPDLALGAVRLADPNPDELQAVDLTAEVRNQGSAGKDAHDVLVQVLDGGVPVAERTVPLVVAGGSARAVLPVALAGVGPHNLSVLLDPRDLIHELDETNNAANLRAVVGKLNVTVRMSNDTYGVQDPARGVAHVQFLGSGRALRFHEVSVPVEYVLRPVDLADPALPQALAAVGALTAKARAASDQALSVCVLGGTCVNATVDQALDVARTLGAGTAAGLGGVEFTFRVATIAARTDARGDAAFDVPQDLPGIADAARGAGMVALCLDAPLAGPPTCAQVAEPAPSLPQVGDLPGTYRATAAADWFGFGFAGRAAYQHAAV